MGFGLCSNCKEIKKIKSIKYCLCNACYLKKRRRESPTYRNTYKKYYAKNRARILKQQAEAYAKDPKKFLTRIKKFQLKYPEKTILRGRKYRRENKEKIREYRRSIKDKVKKYNHKWSNKNKLKKQAQSVINELVRHNKKPRANQCKCAFCENQAIEYHHHKGYEKEHWYDVVPVCHTCHIYQHPESFNIKIEKEGCIC